MGYTIHNFLAGQPLTAEALNEMDNQIKKNTDAAETYTSQMVDERITNLSLKTDGEWLILSYGDVEIAEVAIASVADIIPCEALELTSPDTQNIFVGDTVTITCDKSPTDSNQIIRFVSDALSVASVDSTGLVTGKDVGTAIINAMCGRLTAPTTVRVSKIAKPTWRIGSWLSTGASAAGNPGLTISAASLNRLIAFPGDGDSKIFVKAGQKVVVQPDADHAIQMFWVLTPTGDDLIHEKRWDDSEIITGVTCTEITGSDSTQPFGQAISYTATEDCYIAFMIFEQNKTEFSEYDAETFNDTGAVTITVSPAGN